MGGGTEEIGGNVAVLGVDSCPVLAAAFFGYVAREGHERAPLSEGPESVTVLPCNRSAM